VDIDECELASPKNIYTPLISLCCGKELIFRSSNVVWELMDIDEYEGQYHQRIFTCL
jgi:hypothetical protein